MALKHKSALLPSIDDKNEISGYQNKKNPARTGRIRTKKKGCYALVVGGIHLPQYKQMACQFAWFAEARLSGDRHIRLSDRRRNLAHLGI